PPPFRTSPPNKQPARAKPALEAEQLILALQDGLMGACWAAQEMTGGRRDGGAAFGPPRRRGRPADTRSAMSARKHRAAPRSPLRGTVTGGAGSGMGVALAASPLAKASPASPTSPPRGPAI